MTVPKGNKIRNIFLFSVEYCTLRVFDRYSIFVPLSSYLLITYYFKIKCHQRSYVSLGVCRISFSFSWAGLAKMASSWSVSIQCHWSSVKSPPHLCCSYQGCQDEISARPPGPRLEHDRKGVCVRVTAVPIALKHELTTRARQPDNRLLVRLLS